MPLQTLKPRVATLGRRLGRIEPAAPTITRITGRALQARRLRIWSKDPTCARCGKLTRWPAGFALDHVIALTNGGPDTDENCQVLCVDGADGGCHGLKTIEDMAMARGQRR